MSLLEFAVCSHLTAHRERGATHHRVGHICTPREIALWEMTRNQLPGSISLLVP